MRKMATAVMRGTSTHRRRLALDLGSSQSESWSPLICLPFELDSLLAIAPVTSRCLSQTANSVRSGDLDLVSLVRHCRVESSVPPDSMPFNGCNRPECLIYSRWFCSPSRHGAACLSGCEARVWPFLHQHSRWHDCPRLTKSVFWRICTDSETRYWTTRVRPTDIHSRIFRGGHVQPGRCRCLPLMRLTSSEWTVWREREGHIDSSNSLESAEQQRNRLTHTVSADARREPVTFAGLPSCLTLCLNVDVCSAGGGSIRVADLGVSATVQVRHTPHRRPAGLRGGLPRGMAPVRDEMCACYRAVQVAEEGDRSRCGQGGTGYTAWSPRRFASARLHCWVSQWAQR